VGAAIQKKAELYTREVVHKAERLVPERIEEVIHEKDSSSPRR
jgi:hypothetical protein